MERSIKLSKKVSHLTFKDNLDNIKKNGFFSANLLSKNTNILYRFNETVPIEGIIINKRIKIEETVPEESAKEFMSFLDDHVFFWNNQKFKNNMLSKMVKQQPCVEIILNTKELIELNKDKEIFVTFYNTGSNGFGNSPSSKKPRSKDMFIPLIGNRIRGNSDYISKSGVRELVFKHQVRIDERCISETVEHPRK